MRWSLLLQEYSFDVILIPGKENIFADFLSRHPNPSYHETLLDDDRLVLPPQKILDNIPEKINVERVCLTNDDLYSKIVIAQRTSRRISQNKTLWKNLERAGPQNPRDERFFREHLVEDDLWWRRDANGIKLIVPSRYIKRILAHHHDTTEVAHPGAEETIREIRRIYYFNNINRITRTYVRDCVICSSIKTNKKQKLAPLKPRSPKYPFKTLSMDTIGPLAPQANGNRFIIIAEDIFTKWVEAKAVVEVTGKELTIFINQLISRYGTPKCIISDNGPPFVSNIFTQFCTKQHIVPYKTPVYHQRSNCVERKVQELKKIMRTLMFPKRNKSGWEIYLEPALRILRTRKNEAIGMTPARALYGQELPRVGDWSITPLRRERGDNAAARRGRRAVIRNKQLIFNQKNFTANPIPPLTFNVGDQVMLKELRNTQGEFHPKWTGPHKITNINSPETYTLIREGFEILVHIDKLRPAPRGNVSFHDSDNDEPLSSRSSLSENSESSSSDEGNDHDDRPTNPCTQRQGSDQLGESTGEFPS